MSWGRDAGTFWYVTWRVCLFVAVVFAVLVVTETYTNRRSECPIQSWLRPLDRTPIRDSDWIQDNYALPGPHLRMIWLYADGRIERDTDWNLARDRGAGCHLDDKDRYARVDPVKARTLIQQARDAGFCRLCGDYRSRARVSDSAGGFITLHTEQNEHRVGYYAVEPPAPFETIDKAVQSIAPPWLKEPRCSF